MVRQTVVRCLALCLGLALGLSLGLAAGCGGRAWATVSDPHGFSLEAPRDWAVKVDARGFVLCQPAAAAQPGEVLPTVFFWPVFAVADLKAQDLLAGVWPTLLGDWPQGATRWIGGRGVLVATIGSSAPARGLIVVSVSGSSGLVSGWWAPKGQEQNWRPVCLRILESFTYDPAAVRPDELGVVRLSPWTEPNEGAFTIDVPAGWQVQGGLVRPYIDAAVSLLISRGDEWIAFNDPAVPIYACPNWVLDMAGFTRGSSYNPGGSPTDLVVWDYLDGVHYVRDILAPRLAKSAEGLKVTGAAEVSAPASNNPLVARSSAAVAVLADAAGFNYKVKVLTQLIQVPGSPGVWMASVAACRARPENSEAVGRLMEAIGGSIRVDPGWAARESQAVAQRSQIISQTGEEIAQIISDTFAYQSAVEDHTSHEWSNAMLGRTDVYDPDSGEVWNVPSGAQSYWKRGFEIWGSSTTSPPVVDPDFVELQELGG